MEPEEFVCERILLLMELFQTDIYLTNIELAAILGVEEELVSKVIREMVETGLIFRHFDQTAKTRILSESSEPVSLPVQAEVLQRKKKVSKEKRNHIINLFLFKSKCLLLRNSPLSLTKKSLNNMNKAFSGADTPVDTISNKKIQETPAPFRVPGVVKEIVEFWNSTGFPSTIIKDTKKFNSVWIKINQARKGTLLYREKDMEQRKFTALDILSAIKNFRLFSFDKDYGPQDWPRDRFQKTQLDQFLYNPYAYSPENRSLLLKFQEPPTPNSLTEEDKYPQISSVFRNFYRKEILGGFKVDNITPVDENKIRKAANKTAGFFRKNRNKFLQATVMGGVTSVKVGSWVCESVLRDRERFDNDNIPLSAGFLCSDRTFEYRLPAYLKEQGIWE